MKPLKVFADFHNADSNGRLRLNCIGTIQDLAQNQIFLQEDMALTLYSEDLEVEGRIQYSQDENLWVAVIDWEGIRKLETKSESATEISTVQRKTA